jgi:uncharacterized protein (TIGR02421 family)
MQTLSEKEIICRIRNRERFSAVINTAAFTITIDRYVPGICTAIHDGHNIRGELADKLLVDDAERRYEEDPFTGKMIGSFPITMRALDSRYIYDLNRPPGNCVYEEAWGKKVWREPLTRKEVEIVPELHASYYWVLHALISKLDQLFSGCIVYDLHSYNYQRLEPDTPLFNIGTHTIAQGRYRPVLHHLKEKLLVLDYPNIDNRVAFDEVFQGKGYQAAFIRDNFKGVLCIPLEIKKVFMDESTGEPYPLILEAFIEGLKQALSLNAAYFARRHTGKKNAVRSEFLAESSDKAIRRVDAALYRIAKGIDTLLYVNPVNLAREKKRFFAKQRCYTPRFRYRQLKIDPFLFREKLYAIPVDTIRDVSIRQMYRNTIDTLARKIDLLTTIGTEQFLYNSLRFYGEPQGKDITNARFFICAPEIEAEDEPTVHNAESAVAAFHAARHEYGIDCRVELSSRIVARAMVDNKRRAVLINRNAAFTDTDLRALIHHELGVHMVTTVNANKQPLRIFKLGLPGNTETQEGLAILSEYLSGNMTLARVKTLACRIIAVHMMVQNFDFSRTFKALTDDYGLDRESAFTLTVRVYRGGGFTKDYLYLSGFREALRLYHSGADMRNLYVGKTSFAFHEILNEMRARKLINEPAYLPRSLNSPPGDNIILDYLLQTIA